MIELVSLIIPCYNADKFLHNLINSILNQSYPKIECLFYDDGSTDNTENLILSYKSLFEAKGYHFYFHKQKNSKPASIINKGIKLIKGKYVSWPDSDDYYRDPNIIQEMVNKLNNSSDNYGGIRINATRKIENTDEEVGLLARDNWFKREDIFNDVLFEKFIWYAPICYMFKSDVLFNVLFEKSIYDNNHVQNWQIYLPVFFSYKCLNLNKSGANYLVRENSISNSFYGYEHFIEKEKKHLDIIISTLDRILFMKEKDKLKYKEKIYKFYYHKYINISYRFGSKNDFNNIFKLSMSIFKIKHIIKYLFKNIKNDSKSNF